MIEAILTVIALGLAIIGAAFLFIGWIIHDLIKTDKPLPPGSHP